MKSHAPSGDLQTAAKNIYRFLPNAPGQQLEVKCFSQGHSGWLGWEKRSPPAGPGAPAHFLTYGNAFEYGSSFKRKIL